MPRRHSLIVDRRLSPVNTERSLSDQSNILPQLPPIAGYPSPDLSQVNQRPYSETILQPSISAPDNSSLPQINILASPGSSSYSHGGRRRSSGSMTRNASMTFENITPSSTPTGRISKARKGRRVHACGFPGCGKVFTRAEHQRRHEQNHNPEAMYQCSQPGCGKSFHRSDLLQRHQERHEFDASTSVHTPQRGIVFTSPPSVIPSSTPTMTTPHHEEGNPGSLTGGAIPIGSLLQSRSQYQMNDSRLGYSGLPGYMSPYTTLDETGYYTGSDTSSSPLLDNLGSTYHPPTTPFTSAGYETPIMTTSIPSPWLPAATTTTPPVILSNMFGENNSLYMPSQPGPPVSVSLSELDGIEWATIQQKLSAVPHLLFDFSRTGISDTIRWDCLEYYWKFFHPWYPVVHKPTFLPTRPSPLLASAMIAIGSFFDSRPDAQLYSLALLDIASMLLQKRRQLVSSTSRITDIQTVFLIEAFSKYYSNYISILPSQRFRDLLSSLKQSEQWLSTDPLALLHAQKDQDTEGSKKAQRFWIEHETRRRIFHTCLVLDTQITAFFGSDSTKRPARNQNSSEFIKVGWPCDEELWEASPTEEWVKKANITLDLSSANVNHQPSVTNTQLQSPLHFQIKMMQANSSYSDSDLDEVEERCKRLHYLATELFAFTPVRSLVIVAGQGYFLNDKVSQSEYFKAQVNVDAWIDGARQAPDLPHADIVQAHHNAIHILRLVVDHVNPAPIVKTTNLIHENWSVYVAVLVCWARGLQTRAWIDEVDTPMRVVTRKRSFGGQQQQVETQTTTPRGRTAKRQRVSPPRTTPPPTMDAIDAARQDWPDIDSHTEYTQATTARELAQTIFQVADYVPPVARLSTPPAPEVSATVPTSYPSVQNDATHHAREEGYSDMDLRTPRMAQEVIPQAQTSNVTAVTVTTWESLQVYFVNATPFSTRKLELLPPTKLGHTLGLIESIRDLKLGGGNAVGALMQFAVRSLNDIAGLPAGHFFTHWLSRDSSERSRRRPNYGPPLRKPSQPRPQVAQAVHAAIAPRLNQQLEHEYYAGVRASQVRRAFQPQGQMPGDETQDERPPTPETPY